MSGAAVRVPDFISVEGYLEGELRSDVRHEYYDGRVYAMAGASARHNVAVLYFASRIAAALEDGPCQAFVTDMKVRLSLRNADLFYYPDVFVACDPEDRHPYYREKPKFWLEVMSGDENKDRVEKFLASQRIASLEEFVLVSADPDKPEVSVARRADGWEGEILSGGEVTFRSLGVTVPVDALYEKLRRV
jgi:Uma2 family endonuclease